METYILYAVDSIGEKAIKFDVYAKYKLTELSMVDVRDIYFGDLSKNLLYNRSWSN